MREEGDTTNPLDHNYYGAFPAYDIDGRVLCARCAMVTLRTPFILRHGRFPLSMEELIAADLLGSIDGSRTGKVVIPVAYIDPEATCASCKSTLGERA